MFALKHFKTKYNSSNKATGFKIKEYEDINANKRYAEYAVDIYDMTNMLRTATFEEKFVLLAAIEAAESKKRWHLKHPNFNASIAGMLIQTAINAPRISKEQQVVKNKRKK